MPYADMLSYATITLSIESADFDIETERYISPSFSSAQGHALYKRRAIHYARLMLTRRARRHYYATSAVIPQYYSYAKI